CVDVLSVPARRHCIRCFWCLSDLACSEHASHSFCSFFTGPGPPDFYTLSLHDALPISRRQEAEGIAPPAPSPGRGRRAGVHRRRSEEHTSELQSHLNLVCRLLLEKKKHSPTFRPAAPHTLTLPAL